MGASNFKYSDIDISKREDWRNFIELMQQGKYTEALAEVQDYKQGKKELPPI